MANERSPFFNRSYRTSLTIATGDRPIRVLLSSNTNAKMLMTNIYSLFLYYINILINVNGLNIKGARAISDKRLISFANESESCPVFGVGVLLHGGENCLTQGLGFIGGALKILIKGDHQIFGRVIEDFPQRDD